MHVWCQQMLLSHNKLENENLLTATFLDKENRSVFFFVFLGVFFPSKGKPDIQLLE